MTLLVSEVGSTISIVRLDSGRKSLSSSDLTIGSATDRSVNCDFFGDKFRRQVRYRAVQPKADQRYCHQRTSRRIEIGAREGSLFVFIGSGRFDVCTV